MDRSMIDKWANFMANEKLVPSRMHDDDVMRLVALCEALAAIRGPKISSHQDKLESRKLVCDTAMTLGFDLLAIRDKRKGKALIGRGLLDAWNKHYVVKYGSNIGTSGVYEAKRRDIRTKLSRED